jgi:FkbM family methyltransferase
MTPEFYTLLKKITDNGLDIKVVYDIGAFIGDWSVNTKLVLPNAQFIMFEANGACGPYLQKTNIPFFAGTALSGPGKKTVPFFNSLNSNSSYYKDTMTVYDNQESTEIPSITLDELFIQSNLPIPNLVKLDTQGSELDILSGASCITDNADLILIECPIITCNYGAPNLGDYLAYFKKYRYIPLDIVQKHIGEDTLVQVDILFMKEQSKEKYLGPNKLFRAFE